MEFKEAYEKMQKAKVEALASSTNIKIGRRELTVAMKATKSMIAIEEEMNRITQDSYREVDKYNALSYVLEQCK